MVNKNAFPIHHSLFTIHAGGNMPKHPLLLMILDGWGLYQDLTRISKAIADGDFFRNPVLLDCLARTKAAGGRLHLAGLLSDGGVHSHDTHLYALLELAKRQGVKEVFIHCLL